MLHNRQEDRTRLRVGRGIGLAQRVAVVGVTLSALHFQRQSALTCGAAVVGDAAAGPLVLLETDEADCANCDCWGLCDGTLSAGADEDDWRFIGGGVATAGPNSDVRGVPDRAEDGAVEGVLVFDGGWTSREGGGT